MSNVEFKNAVKKYGKLAVIHGIDLKLDSGDFVVFVGPSGCGKSTLLRMIAGLEKLSDGEVHIGDKNMTDVAAVDRGIAMVFQSYALYPHMTAAENMGFGLRMNGVDANIIEDKVQTAAKTLQLEELLDRKPKNMSGGQRQRVAIGRAIVRDPDVFLFDEPLSNLDAELRVEMRLQIARLHKQLGATMIYVTHDQVEAMTMADKIVVLRDGVVEQLGSPLELYHHPQNLFVAGFIGSPRMNLVSGKLLEASATHARVELVDGVNAMIPIDASNGTVGSTVSLGIRPEDLGNNVDGFSLSMQVDVAERLGGSTYLYGQCAGLNNFVVQRTGLDLTESGQVIDIQVPETECHLFDQNGLAFKRNASVAIPA